MQPPAAFTWKMLLCTRYTGEKIHIYVARRILFQRTGCSGAAWLGDSYPDGWRHCSHSFYSDTGTALVLHSGNDDGSTAGTGTAPRECWGHVVEHFNLNDLFQTRTQHSSQQVTAGDNRETALGIISYTVSIWFIIIMCLHVTLVMRDRDVVKILFRNIVGVWMRNEFLNIIVLSN